MPPNQQPVAKPRRLSAWLGWVVVSLPVLAAYTILLRNFTAVPIIDDYPELIAFAIDFEKTPGLLAKLGLLFTAQIGPYKLVLDHSLVGLQLLLFGHLNFPVLIVLGNLMPLCIFLVLQRHVARTGSEAKDRWLVLLPVSLLLFSLNDAETLDWAMIGLQHPAVILFTLLSLHFLMKGGSSSFWGACLLGILASATSANGLLLWPVGLLYLLLHDRRPARLMGWCAAIGVTLFGYFFRFQPATISAHGTLGGKLLFLTMFCGSAMENMHHRPVPYVSVLIGAFVLLCFADAIRTRYDRRNPFFFFTTVWLVLTAAVVANGRIAMGLELSLSSRYKIFCDMLLICSFVYLVGRVQQRSAFNKNAMSVRMFCIGSSVVGLLVCVGGDAAGAHMLAQRKLHAETAMRQYLAAPESASPMFVVEDVLNPAEVEEEDRARDELNEAIRLGIYVLPKRLVAEAEGSGRLAEARPEWFAAAVVSPDGRKTYPAAALAGAYRATVPWGMILLDDAVYVSPFTEFGGNGCGGVAYDSPRRFVGAGRPHVDDESQPQELVGGTVIRGEICGGAPLQMAHLGVDAGPQVTRELYRGVKPNGIYLPNPGGFNPKRGTELKDVSVLTNGAEGEHSVLIEGEDGAIVDGLWIWTTGGTHGLIIKSAHTWVNHFHCKGASADCLLVKSDYRTDGDGYAADDRFEDVDIRYLAKPGDTGGIEMDARWDNISDVVFDGVREEGLRYGFEGGGSWFYKLKGVAIQHWASQQLSGPCTRFYHRSQVSVSDSSCVDDRSAVAKRSFGARFKAFVVEVKQHLRIVWTTFCTWCRRIVHSLRG